MQMHTQDTGDLEHVVTRLRGRVWRDWLVAALFAVGVVVNVAAVNTAVKAALAAPPSAAEMVAAQHTADPDAGLVAVAHDAARERVVAAQ
jgi:hypothetical protein